MSLRINTNVSAIIAHNNLASTDSAMSSNIEKLSSGYRINSASDDAAGLAIANKLSANVRSLTVASQNVTEATSLLSIAEGSADEVEEILERMKELATQAASSNTGSEIDKLSSEYNNLVEEIDRIVSDTDYQGTTLLDGTFAGTFQVGSGNTAGVDTLSISINGLSSTSLGVAANDISTQTGAQTTLATIDTAIDTINGVLGNIGSSMNRLDYTYSNLQTAIENYSSSESVIRDVDMASEMTSYTKNQILLQAGTAMLAQANSSSQTILSLFQ